ncbi:MAG: tyrosine-type recombinase/integrase [Halobacteriota archaeon]
MDLEYHTGMVRILKAKGNKQRRLPLDDPETLAQPQAYIEANAIPAEAPLFPITQQWVLRLLNTYSRLIGKKIHPHLPARFAINSVWQGVDLRRLQQVLGHININTTAVYLQFNDQDLQDVYASPSNC